MKKHVFYYYYFLLLPFALPSVIFAQVQPPCSGSVNITDTSQAQPSVLVVVSNSAQASFTINGPTMYHGSGYYWVQQGIPSGTYTITWNAVAGCGTPPSETKTTDAKGSAAFAGNYKDLSAPVGYGTIEIKTNINRPTTFMITGPASKTAEGNGFTWLSVQAGTYTVTYGTIEGYSSPSPETKILSPGESLLFYGEYKIRQTTKSDKQTFTIKSMPSGAHVFVNGILIGDAPVKAMAYYGSRSKVQCFLDGYEDYETEYRAPDPEASGIVVDPGWTCVMIKKTAPVKTRQLPGTGQGFENKIIVPQSSQTEQTVSEKNTAPQTPPPQKTQRFFSRIWISFLSLFGG